MGLGVEREIIKLTRTCIKCVCACASSYRDQSVACLQEYVHVRTFVCDCVCVYALRMCVLHVYSTP